MAVSIVMALLVSLLAPFALTPLLKRMGVVDVPNERSSHSILAIRGVGLAPLLAVVTGFAILLFDDSGNTDSSLLMLIALVSLASGALGWLEDSRGLAVAIRAGGQLVIGLTGAGTAVALYGSFWWLTPFLGFVIAGYINVANFMDGINGISGLHGLVVGLIYAVIGFLTEQTWMIPAGLVISVAFLGFLPWNLKGAGMFLGDVGSYTLGGGIAIVAVAGFLQGVPVLAVLGPLVIYLTDAGVTLARRISSGERWYQAHRTHTYQRLTDLGMSHLKVALIVSLATAGTGLAGLFVIRSESRWWLSALLMFAIVLAYLSFEVAILKLRALKGSAPTKGSSR